MLKKIVIVGITMSCAALLFFVPSISQDPSYHHFADGKTVWGLSNFNNVISNLPFFILGLMGLFRCWKNVNAMSFSGIPFITLFIGVTGIGLGSAYYHTNPENATLIWDRIPMTITFMSYFSIIVGTYINRSVGSLLLFPLLIIGIASVLVWYRGELTGEGDLRLYALVQFYPMIMIPLIVFIYPAPSAARIEIVSVITLYGIAKVMESHDVMIHTMSGEVISGHTLKHLFAAAAIAVIVQGINRNTVSYQNGKTTTLREQCLNRFS